MVSSYHARFIADAVDRALDRRTTKLSVRHTMVAVEAIKVTSRVSLEGKRGSTFVLTMSPSKRRLKTWRFEDTLFF